MSGRSKLHTLGAAYEQRCAKGLFQVGQPLAHRGSHRVTAFGRPRDAARLSDGDKVLEIAEIKVQSAFPEVLRGGGRVPTTASGLLDRASCARIDAHDGQSFRLPLRDATRQVRGRLTKRHALTGCGE